MFESFAEGLGNILLLQALTVIVLGTLIGTIVGILPTMGGLEVMGLMLVFILYIPPEVGLLLLIAMVGVTETGGSITSILLNIPGTAINAATVIDGFPMTQKGHASRAVGAALTASVFGGVAAVFLAFLMVPMVIPLVLAMRVGDISIMVLLGMTLLATLTTGSVFKGLIAGFLGMFVSLIGVYLPTGTERFAFGTVYLYDGLSIVPVVVGLFGIGTLLDTISRGESSLASGLSKTRFSDILVGAKDVLQKWWLWLRCTVLGYFIGVIPGVGASVATFTAYGYAKQVSKHPEEFGKGNVEGVIAPESANNAKEAGGLLTTLAFGLPGSASMAIFLAALYAVDVVPGPSMLLTNLQMVFYLLMGVGISQVTAGVFCFAGAPWLIKAAYTPMRFLFPLIMVLIFVGCFAERITMAGVGVAIIFGVLGFIMARLEYSRPAFVLGFVLAGLFEENLFLALKTAGPFFFTTPISLVFIALIVVMFSLPTIKNIFAGRSVKVSHYEI